MAHVNLLKQFKTGNGWVLKSIPRKPNGQRDWGALPDGSYFIEWREGGKRCLHPRPHSMRRRPILIGSHVRVLSTLAPSTRFTPVHLHRVASDFWLGPADISVTVTSSVRS